MSPRLLNVDTRTSREGLGCYVLITGHFIDGDWKPQQRKLNVVMVPNPDSESALANAVLRCLSDWNLEECTDFRRPVGARQLHLSHPDQHGEGVVVSVWRSRVENP
ncbi:unnamed protein product [Linum tenue]|uniref:Uncharacterized protein n=1 Tax=Linum tenue TaxID=586396 RepID=A0AAV0PHG5_9ROSI|nr:unnamed protein product [Linum tenue]